MKSEKFNIEYCIEKEYSTLDFFKYLDKCTRKEHEIINKCKVKDIREATGCSYYQIQKFCEGKRINLRSYFKLVKYARLISIQIQ